MKKYIYFSIIIILTMFVTACTIWKLSPLREILLSILIIIVYVYLTGDKYE